MFFLRLTFWISTGDFGQMYAKIKMALVQEKVIISCSFAPFSSRARVHPISSKLLQNRSVVGAGGAWSGGKGNSMAFVQSKKALFPRNLFVFVRHQFRKWGKERPKMGKSSFSSILSEMRWSSLTVTQEQIAIHSNLIFSHQALDK